MKEDRGFYRVIGIFILAIIVILMISAFVGCNVGQKAVAKYQASTAFSKDCADSFPIKIDTTYIEGKVVYDTIWNYDTDMRYDTVTNNQETIIYKTIVKTVTKSKVDTLRLTKENTARITAIQRQQNQDSIMHAKEVKLLKEYLAKSEAKTKKRTQQRNVGWGLLSAVGLYTFRNQLIGLFSGGFGSIWALFLGLFKRKKS